jgi:glycosyltransferase involved in cell wall biosynthesis
MKKILFIPPGVLNGWYMEAHYEYLIRYLSDEFFIEMAGVPYEPFDNFLDRYPETNPFMRNPNEYDLIIPLLPTHAGVPTTQEWFDKMAIVMYEPGEGHWNAVKVLGSTTDVTDAGEYPGKEVHKLRFGIDTELFQPFPMVREDDLLHVGVVGSYGNPRRMFEEAIKPLFDLEGVRIMIFPQMWINNGGTEDKIERQEFLKRVVSGGKFWPGLPNVYNRMDVLLRCDSYNGVSFPVLEAAACGVPVIATSMGIDHHITDAGGGILIDKDEPKLAEKVREAVIWMRDNPKDRKWMGQKARKEIRSNWKWDDHIEDWRKFLRAATI